MGLDPNPLPHCTNNIETKLCGDHNILRLMVTLVNLAQFPTANLSLFRHIVVARATVRGRAQRGFPYRRNFDALTKCRTIDTFSVASKQVSLFRRFPNRRASDVCKLSHFQRNVVRRFERRSSDVCKLSQLRRNVVRRFERRSSDVCRLSEFRRNVVRCFECRSSDVFILSLFRHV